MDKNEWTTPAKITIQGIEIDEIKALIDKHNALLQELHENLDKLVCTAAHYKIAIKTCAKEMN